MSAIHRQAMEAVLQAAASDIQVSIRERHVSDDVERDDAVMDVAILHAYRVFCRICENNGLGADPGLFSDMAVDLAEDLVSEGAEGAAPD